MYSSNIDTIIKMSNVSGKKSFKEKINYFINTTENLTDIKN